MPNPLTSITRKLAAPIAYGVAALEQRPEMARRIGLVIGAWAYVENALALLLGRLLGTQAHVGAAVWRSLNSSTAQKAALHAAAGAMLSGSDLALFNRLMHVTDGVRNERNPIVHNLGAYADELPDQLLLIPSMEYSAVEAEYFRNAPAGGESTLVPSGFYDKVMVYTEAELLALHGRLVTLHGQLMLFGVLLAFDPEQRDALRWSLNRELDTLGSTARKTVRGNTPTAPPQSPQSPEPRE
jgi:hypothetical protein